MFNLSNSNPWRRLQKPVAESISKLNKRTQPNARTYVSRLGYNIACTSYTGGIEIGRLSGSSLNRLIAKRKKDESQLLSEDAETVSEKVGNSIDEYLEYKQEIKSLRRDIISKQGIKKSLSKPLGKPIDRLPMRIHVLSPRSKGKVRDKCTAFYRACGKNKTFATLTFIQGIDDKTGMDILNKFFTQLREDFGANLKYIWIAERQNNNARYPGNIHFHVIFNQFMPVARYNALWVLQQYNEGLRYENVSMEEIRERIKDETLQKILNPFDIEKIRGVYGLSYYLTKYVTKNKSDGFNCLSWHCSRSVSRLFTKTVVTRSTFAAAESFMNAKIDKQTGELIRPQPQQGNFHILYFIYNRPFFLKEMAELEQVNKWVLGGFSPGDIPTITDYHICKFYNN